MYMVGSDTAALYSINLSTGAATRIGSATQFGISEADPRALAWNGSTMYMLGANNDWLYTLDLTTGVATRVGSVSQFGVSEGNPQGLAWNSNNNTMYMVGRGNDVLYTLDLTTGMATRVGSATQFGISERQPAGLEWNGTALYMVGGQGLSVFDDEREDNELPDGITLSSAGLLTINTDAARTGSTDIRAQNNDGHADATVMFNIAAPPMRVAPSWSAVDDITQRVNLGLSLDLNDFVSGTPTPAITLHSGTLPTGATFSNGIVGGIPNAPGTFTVTFRATNSEGTDDVTVSFTIQPPPPPATVPVWSTVPRLTGEVGTMLSYNLATYVTGSPDPTFSIVPQEQELLDAINYEIANPATFLEDSGSLVVRNDGIAIDDNGRGFFLDERVFNRIEPEISVGDILVLARSPRSTSLPRGFTGTYKLTITKITEIPSADQLSRVRFEGTWDRTPPQLRSNQSYTQQLGIIALYLESEPSLPDGLTLTEAGVLSGTPTMVSIGNFIFRATNTAGVDDQDVVISIASLQPAAPQWGNIPDVKHTKDNAYSLDLNDVVAGKPAPTIAVQSGTLPSGLTLTAGVLSGTPDTKGKSTVTFRATNTQGTDDVTVVFDIVEKQAPSWGGQSGIFSYVRVAGLVGQNIDFDLKRLVNGSPPLDFSLPVGSIELPASFNVRFSQTSSRETSVAWRKISDPLQVQRGGRRIGVPVMIFDFDLAKLESDSSLTSLLYYISQHGGTLELVIQKGAATNRIKLNFTPDGPFNFSYLENDGAVTWRAVVPSPDSQENSKVTVDGDINILNLGGTQTTTFIRDALGGTAKLIYTPLDGFDNSLPPGLSLTDDGRITGISYRTVLPASVVTAAHALLGQFPLHTIFRAENSEGHEDQVIQYFIEYPPNYLAQPRWLSSVDTELVLQRNTNISINLANLVGGFPEPTVSIASGSLPLRLSFSNGRITGRPTANGQSRVTFRATNTQGTDDVTVVFVVVENNAQFAPQWLVEGDITLRFETDFVAGPEALLLTEQQFANILVASPLATVSVVAGTIPDGLELRRDSVTGHYFFVYNKVATFDTQVTLRATNPHGSADKIFILKVGEDDVPVIIPASAPDWGTIAEQTAQVNQLLNINLHDSLAGSPTPTIAIQSGTLPAGLSLSDNGTVSGRPTNVGRTTVTFRATNTQGTDDIDVVFNIVSLNTAPVWSLAAESTRNYEKDQLLNLNLNNFVVGNPTPTIAVQSGTLPNGVTLANGILSGTPDTAGMSAVVFRATNSEGTKDVTIVFNIVASIASFKPVWQSVPTLSGNVDSAFIYNLANRVSASPTATITVKSTSALPSGITLNTAGLLSGTPDTAGMVTTTFVATNDQGATEIDVTFDIQAALPPPPDSAPVWVSPGIQSLTLNGSYSLSLNALVTGKPTPTITHKSGTLPNGVNFAAGQLSGTPNLKGRFESVFTATNSEGAVDITIVFNVRIAGNTPVWTGIPTQNVQVGTPFIIRLENYFSGMPTPTIAIQSGTLPTGLTLIGSVISGISTDIGITSVVLRATNELGMVDTTLTFNVQTVVPIQTDIVPIVLPAGYTLNNGCFIVDDDRFYFALQNASTTESGLLAVYDRTGVRQESEEISLPTRGAVGVVYVALEKSGNEFYLLTTAFGRDNNVSYRGQIHVFDTTGTPGQGFFVIHQDPVLQLGTPTGLYLDTNRNIFGVVEEYEGFGFLVYNRVRLYNLRGDFISTLGGRPGLLADLAYANTLFYTDDGEAYNLQLARTEDDDVELLPDNANPAGVGADSGQIFIYDRTEQKVFVYGNPTVLPDAEAQSFVQFRGFETKTEFFNIFEIGGDGTPNLIAQNVEMLSRTTAQFVNAGADVTITAQTQAHTFVPRKTIPGLEHGHIITRYNDSIIPSRTQFEIVGFATTGNIRTQRIFTIQKEEV